MSTSGYCSRNRCTTSSGNPPLTDRVCTTRSCLRRPSATGPNTLLYPVQLTEQRDPLFQEHRAGGGQGDTLRSAVEQVRTQFAFQDLDLLGQSRLGDVQPLGRPPEMQFLRHHREVLQAPQIHPPTIAAASHRCPDTIGPLGEVAATIGGHPQPKEYQ